MAAAAKRKAENLQRRLAKAYSQHPGKLLALVWEDGDDLVLKVTSDEWPALQVRDWLNAGLGGHDLYRIACGQVEKAVTKELERHLANEEWLAACAAMTH